MKLGSVNTGIYLTIIVFIEDINTLDIECIENLIKNLKSKIEIVFLCNDILLDIMGTLATKNIKVFSYQKINNGEVYHLARGKYILFMNNGDNLFPQDLDKLLDFLQTSSSDVVHISGVYKNQLNKISFDGLNQVKIKTDNLGKGMELLPKCIETRLLFVLENKLHDNYSSVLYKREFLFRERILIKRKLLLSKEWSLFIEGIVKAQSYMCLPTFLIIEPNTYDRVIENIHLENFLLEQEQMIKYITFLLKNNNVSLNVIDKIENLYINRILERLPKQINCDNADRRQLLLQKYISSTHEYKDKYSALKEHYTLSNIINNARGKIIEQMMHNVKRIGIFGSAYTFLLYTLIFKDWEDTLFLFVHSMPRNITNNILKMKIPCFWAEFPLPLDFNVVNELSEYAKKYNIPVYGNEDSMEAGYFIRHNFIGIEDGAIHPTLSRSVMFSEKLHLRDKYGNKFIPFGFCEDEKKVYYTNSQPDEYPVPVELLDKVEIIDVYKLWKGKTKKEQELLIKLFDVPLEKISNANLQGRDIIFFTGCYSDNPGYAYCSVEKEVAMYKEIIEQFDENKIIIKPHPRSKLEYEKYFPDVLVLREIFPAEFFQMLDCNFSKYVGINTSSLAGIFPREKIVKFTELEHKYHVTDIEIK